MQLVDKDGHLAKHCLAGFESGARGGMSRSVSSRPFALWVMEAWRPAYFQEHVPILEKVFFGAELHEQHQYSLTKTSCRSVLQILCCTW